ncbi:CLUMA_CG002143, isoform A [Clunio marinus]|uniref:CLUMA_CG002143, isoform A n=1 Tax=Clunio marinus TaxID=568069 RepID=A0A1J1HPG4_9DIPT|nr:CLUMA_CG002143, isoform A [Clunio marinus]
MGYLVDIHFKQVAVLSLPLTIMAIFTTHNPTTMTSEEIATFHFSTRLTNFTIKTKTFFIINLNDSVVNKKQRLRFILFQDQKRFRTTSNWEMFEQIPKVLSIDESDCKSFDVV